MAQWRGVLLDLDTIDRQDLDLSGLNRVCGHWDRYPGTQPDQVRERIRGAQVVVTNKVVLDRPILESAADLRLVCVAATGTNNLDLVAARELGIPVANVVGYSTPSVVQHVFAMILAFATRWPDYARDIRAGAWQSSGQFCLLDYPIWELAGRRLGIVGHGTLGKAVAEVAKGFGMEVWVAQRPGRDAQAGRVPLKELLPEVAVLSLHCPLTPETQGLIGAPELALMRPDAVLINAARGGVVDEQALADALRRGHIAGAGVDVLTCEPPRDGNPLLAPDIPNLILTPHTAWASREARQRLMNEIIANIQAFRQGGERNRVA